MTATDTYMLLRAFCDELARCGMEHACTSPGSRSTPLVLSLVREPRIRCWSHIDERCSGFFALGAAKATAAPVAVTCTSGTAAANLVPAVIEAHEARVPLIVLTADRPPELREVGAGQTIDQIKLYGGAVKWFFEVGVHDATPQNLRWFRALACRAYLTASQGRPGPVHLNFPLREPLVLDGPLPEDPTGTPDGSPWISIRTETPHGAPPPPLPARGIVVAGRHERDRDLGLSVARFAERAGYPLFADPLSGARHGPAAIARYDLLLRDDELVGQFPPELILRVGDLPTSKPLRQWLDRHARVRQIALDPENAWQDPASVVAEIVVADPRATLDAWAPDRPPDPDWLARWRDADDAADAAIASELSAGELSEPLVAARLGEWLGPDAALFVASSMPIRDVELYFPAAPAAPRVLSNRGANGIDGTVSSAFGVAAAQTAPVVLLIGDVALAHDIGGLLAARRLKLALTIVLLNNDGGGIFHFLPVAGEGDAFEEHVATPHGLEFAHAAALYGLEHRRVDTAGGLEAAVRESVAANDATRIIEVHTDREANLVLHRRLAAEVSRRAPAASPRA
ncbi:MAG TPA: 2-succinyl-5-enolpyruvyl-6-hydroxy-3-cyclohexene-1-carboxylic-acid synthase [Solirubrobacteraceae bacterium]